MLLTFHLEVIRKVVWCVVHCRLGLEVHLVGVERVVFGDFEFDFDGLRDVDEVLFAVVAHNSLLLGAEDLIEDRLVVEQLLPELAEVFDVVEAFHTNIVRVDRLHPKLKRKKQSNTVAILRHPGPIRFQTELPY